mmetsp:Transcript_26145/g.30119  ORF Transcript_26145/g.30119 Transcript_26145/m.30119 type:complete len:92 (+) Transcript_26145:199-474(+)
MQQHYINFNGTYIPDQINIPRVFSDYSNHTSQLKQKTTNKEYIEPNTSRNPAAESGRESTVSVGTDVCLRPDCGVIVGELVRNGDPESEES